MKKSQKLYADYYSQNFNGIKKSKIILGMLTALGASNAMADPVVWVEQVRGGEVRFYDWGYEGPNARLANDFSSINGFNGASQIQHVVTTGGDGLTPDSPTGYTIDDPTLIKTDLNTVPFFYEANMDNQTNFYEWGYTSPAGSTFSNMQIDSDGDYFIARDDMAFNYYDAFEYTYEGSASDPAALPVGTAEGTYATNIGFQPYALSDATGWCGSSLASNPGALEAMAGQVTFDFGFEAFLPFTPKGDDGVWQPGEGAMQIVQDFQMRSYGSLEVDVTMSDGTNLVFNADAVVNNTSPLDALAPTDPNLVTAENPEGYVTMITVAVLNMDGTPALDEFGDPRFEDVPDKRVGAGGTDADFYNKVSFMGGGVVPDGVWVRTVDPAAAMSNDNIVEVLDADDGDANTVWWENSFSGYPFLLRADGIRVVDALDMSLYSDYCAIPGAICDGAGNFIGADANAPGSAFNANGELINLEGTVIQDLSAVPVPAAVWLFGSGLVGLAGFARRRKAA